jgi:hypothetical protein
MNYTLNDRDIEFTLDNDGVDFTLNNEVVEYVLDYSIPPVVQGNGFDYTFDFTFG